MKIFAGIAGSHIRSLNSHGAVKYIKCDSATQGSGRRVHVERAMLESAARRGRTGPTSAPFLHVLPQEYVIEIPPIGIRQPKVGMSGVRLEARVHLVNRCGQRGPERDQRRRIPLRAACSS